MTDQSIVESVYQNTMAEQIKPYDICRFCLGLSSQNLHPYTDETINLMNLNFSLQIHKIDSLPNKICDDCNNKTMLLFEFRKSVSENEKRLNEILIRGCNNLRNYIISIQEAKIEKEDEKNGFAENSTIDHCEDGSVNSDHETVETNDTVDCKKDISEIFNNLTDSKHSKVPMINTKNVSQNTNTLTMFKIQCLTCFESFESQNYLLSHYKTEHYEKPKENKLNITITEEIKHDGIVYKCSACSKTYDTKKSINRHIAIAHSDARPFLCKMCGRTYKTPSEIVRHGRVHNGVKLFCTHQCGYSTAYPAALKDHEKRHNASEFKYKCEKCNKGFNVKTWYLQHQNVHTGLKPFVCYICGDAFHMDKYLTTHRSLKHPQSSSLKRYVCVHCSLPCDSRNALTEHLKKEHGVNTEKKFLCDLCGKILSNSEQLKFHKRMHLGDKPYICSTCNKSFAKKFNCQLHERSHAGDSPHACRCGRRYRQRSTLLRHMARHHSEDKLKSPKKLAAPAEHLAAQVQQKMSS